MVRTTLQNKKTPPRGGEKVKKGAVKPKGVFMLQHTVLWPVFRVNLSFFWPKSTKTPFFFKRDSIERFRAVFLHLTLLGDRVLTYNSLFNLRGGFFAFFLLVASKLALSSHMFLWLGFYCNKKG